MFKKKSNRIFHLTSLRRRPGREARTLKCLFLALTFGLNACHTVDTMPPVNLLAGNWTLRQGQAVWSAGRGAPGIAGELVVATNAEGSAFVQFTKTPLPFIVAQSTGHAWQLHSVPDNRTYSGSGNPPVRAIWLWLPQCVAGVTPPKPLAWTASGDNGWRLQNNATGEFLEGYLSP